MKYTTIKRFVEKLEKKIVQQRFRLYALLLFASLLWILSKISYINLFFIPSNYILIFFGALYLTLHISGRTVLKMLLCFYCVMFIATLMQKENLVSIVETTAFLSLVYITVLFVYELRKNK